MLISLGQLEWAIGSSMGRNGTIVVVVWDGYYCSEPGRISGHGGPHSALQEDSVDNDHLGCEAGTWVSVLGAVCLRGVSQPRGTGVTWCDMAVSLAVLFWPNEDAG